MGRSIALLCTLLVLHASPGSAESRFSEPSLRPSSARSSGLERAWPPRSSGGPLVQIEVEVEGDPGVAGGGTDVEARIAELEVRRRKTHRGWPIAGLVTGGLMTVGGIVTLVVIKSTCRDNAFFSSDPPETRCQGGSVDGKWAAGGITLASGLILTGVSAWILAKRNRERRAIRRELLELERARTAKAASSWQLGFDAGEYKTLRVAWRF
ncbi:MAG: hypothetical protein U0900_18490 [Myxococcota bacterium]